MGSLQPFFGVYGNWTLRHYADILADADLIRTVIDTFLIAVAGGFLAVAISFWIAYLLRRRPNTWLAFLARIGSWVPATAPGIVLSLALLWSYLNTPGIRLLYGTPWLMMFALVIGSLPVAVRAVEGIIAQIGTDMEEAALLCGAGRVAAVLEITARLCRPSLIGAWFLVGLSMGGRLDVPLLFASANSQTVATKAFEMWTYGQLSQAAALFLFYLVSGLTVVATAVLSVMGMRILFRSVADAARKRALRISHATV
jgi:iron(III) transport system permease protein